MSLNLALLDWSDGSILPSPGLSAHFRRFRGDLAPDAALQGGGDQNCARRLKNQPCSSIRFTVDDSKESELHRQKTRDEV